MTFVFEEKATRDQVYLRAFLMGPTGSGKSRGALELASRIFNGELPVTLINTELGRANLYADRYDFALVDMAAGGDFSPEAYERAIDLAESRRPGGVFVIDSVSHEWMGRNGILQQADRFGDWKTVRPKHNSWVERLLAVNGHVIVTCRAKMKYEVGEEEVNGRKKQTIRMLGVGPIQSDDLQYEFNLVGRFEQGTHDVEWSGHVDPLVDTVANFGEESVAAEVAATLTRWLSEGNPPPPPPEAAPEKDVEALRASLLSEDDPRITEQTIEEKFAVARRQNRGVISPEYVAEQLAKSKERLAAKKKREGEQASLAAS